LKKVEGIFARSRAFTVDFPGYRIPNIYLINGCLPRVFVTQLVIVVVWELPEPIKYPIELVKIVLVDAEESVLKKARIYVEIGLLISLASVAHRYLSWISKLSLSDVQVLIMHTWGAIAQLKIDRGQSIYGL
jgi:hypothetical protein